MGSYVSKLFNSLTLKKEARILMVGLDGAGKSTILFKLKLGEVVSTIPTIGFNLETVEFKNLKLNIWDIGGQDNLRKFWKHYYQNAEGVIFVVDSSDDKRIGLAREELQKMLADEELQQAAVLVLANKQDLGFMGVREVIEGLSLGELKGREWHCQGTDAISGKGLVEGLGWLHKKLSIRK